MINSSSPIRCLRSELARLDTMVTVVDTAAFADNFASITSMAEENLHEHEHDHEHGHASEAERNECESNAQENVVHLLVSQVECADVVLFNKVDLIDEKELELARTTVSRLNPRAQLLTTTHSAAPIDKIVLTGLFDYRATTSAASWVQLLQADHGQDQASKLMHNTRTTSHVHSKRHVQGFPLFLFGILTLHFPHPHSNLRNQPSLQSVRRRRL